MAKFSNPFWVQISEEGSGFTVAAQRIKMWIHDINMVKKWTAGVGTKWAVRPVMHLIICINTTKCTYSNYPLNFHIPNNLHWQIVDTSHKFG